MAYFERMTDALDHFASVSPDAPATWFEGVSKTYDELKSDVDSFARALLASGVQKGDRVGVLSTPRSEFWVAFLAILRSGAIYVGINPSYTQREQQHVVSNSELKMLFSIGSFENRSFDQDVQQILHQFDSVREVVSLVADDEIPEATSMAEFLSRGTDQITFEMLSPLDPAAIVYTSGSTGAPKGALIPHLGLAYGSYCDAEALGVDTPRTPCNLPTNHLGGLVDVCGSTLVNGGMVAFIERFEPAKMLQLIEELRLTNLQHVPTVLQLLALHPDLQTRDLGSLEVVGWGGAAMGKEFIEIYANMGVRCMTIYGQTETCGNISLSRPGMSIDELASTVGYPNPDGEIRIVDEADSDVLPGEEGEVWFRHPAIFLGYFKNPEATAKTITPDGWLRSGDIACQLPSGALKLTGRKSEMFKSGGLNVYPREIELVLESAPEVAYCAVMGTNDPTYGESGVAFVVLHDGSTLTEEQLKEWCKAGLAGYKVPKRFVVTDSLPLLPIGKVDKKLLREQFEIR